MVVIRNAGFQPSNRAALKTTVDACAAESADFNCPNTIANSPVNGAAIENWDVSIVSEFNDVFSGYSSFNVNISGWDVSAGTTFNRMFKSCASFDQSLESWDVSKSTSFRQMFQYCSVFNQPVGSWDVSTSTDFEEMFNGCAKFNQTIGGWNVAVGREFSAMLSGCTDFNQPLGSWNMAAATGFNEMFKNAPAFNQPIGSWNVSAGSNFNKIFYGATAFSQLLSNWQVTDSLTESKVADMFSSVTALTCTHVSSSNTFSCVCSTNYTSNGVSCVDSAVAAEPESQPAAEPAAEPAPQPSEPEVIIVSAELRIAINATVAQTLISNENARAAFETAFAIDMAAVLGIAASRVTVTSLSVGSLKVGFTISSQTTAATVINATSFGQILQAAGSVPLNAVAADSTVTAITGSSIASVSQELRCGDGYITDSVEVCADIDECANDTDNCDADATCTNAAGSFTCACNSGYSGNGVNCTATPTPVKTAAAGDLLSPLSAMIALPIISLMEFL